MSQGYQIKDQSVAHYLTPRWQVTKLGNLSDIIFEDGDMTHGGTTAISVYNKDQKTIVNTFEDRVNKLENNAYYLFFVENVEFKDRSIAGYMPLQRQVGFIYDNPGLNIIAHELGHGAFNLWHTFSPDNFIATEHTTQNLLDYKGGTDLWKHQWQLVQSPDKLVFGWLQDESEGEAIDDDLIEKTVKGIRDLTVKEISVMNLSDYYINNNTVNINVPKHGHLDFGEDNKFDISYKILNMSDDNTKNKITISEYSEETYNRKYLNVDGQCLTLTFNYKDRSGTGLEMAVPVEQKDKFKDYLFAALFELISEKADSALDAGKGMNPGGVACNLTVRAYLHYLKNDNILFPVSHNGTSTWGAPLCCPTTNSQGETVYAPENIFIGNVEWEGRANNIYSSLQNKELSAAFEEIKKESNQTWKNFFDDIQKKANDGKIIIGVKHNLNDNLSGHIVVFMPENASYPEKTKIIIGGDIGVKKPYALEAGNPDDNEKKIKQFIGTNSEITRTTRPYIYYKYIK